MPGHGTAAVRIVSALHGDLGSVVNAGAPRHGKQYRELLVKHVRIMEAVHQPFRVVGIQQVEHHVIVLLHVHGVAAVYHVFKLRLVHALIQEKSWMPLSSG